MNKITASELKSAIDKRTNAQIVDVRTLTEHIEYRIKEALFLPLELVVNQPYVPLKKHRDVYALSYSEGRAKEFCRILDSLGYRTFFLEGGLKAWHQGGFPLVTTVRNPNPSNRSIYALSTLFRKSNSIRMNSRDTETRLKSVLVFDEVEYCSPTLEDLNSEPVLNIEIYMRPSSVALSHFFKEIVGMVYFFEKLGVNIRFVLEGNCKDIFENTLIRNSPQYQVKNFVAFNYINNLAMFELYWRKSSQEYRGRTISKLLINRDLQSQADEFIKNNLSGDWIGVHYRGTDALWLAYKPEQLQDREIYISMLKEIIKAGSNIFVCSDQAQFIEEMRVAFPGRTFFRDVERSHGVVGLHVDSKCIYRQIRNALVDILILARAKTIYKTIGSFTSIVNMINSSTKIISICMFRVQKLRLRRGASINQPLDFTLHAGQWCLLTGDNGVGKTTLLRVLCGLSEAGQGNVLWKGFSINYNRERYHKEFIYIGHQLGFRGGLSSRENLAFYCDLADTHNGDSIDDAINYFGIADVADQPHAALSHGQQQRAALCRLIVEKVPLWLLDEPTSALDQQGHDIFQALLEKHLGNGGIAVIATHKPFTRSTLQAAAYQIQLKTDV